MGLIRLDYANAIAAANVLCAPNDPSANFYETRYNCQGFPLRPTSCEVVSLGDAPRPEGDRPAAAQSCPAAWARMGSNAAYQADGLARPVA